MGAWGHSKDRILYPPRPSQGLGMAAAIRRPLWRVLIPVDLYARHLIFPYHVPHVKPMVLRHGVTAPFIFLVQILPSSAARDISFTANDFSVVTLTGEICLGSESNPKSEVRQEAQALWLATRYTYDPLTGESFNLYFKTTLGNNIVAIAIIPLPVWCPGPRWRLRFRTHPWWKSGDGNG